MVLKLLRKEVLMSDYCAFSQDHTCVNWLDYQVTREELDEINDLCHGNWIEIQHLRDYIDLLQETLKKHGIEVPPEY